MAKSGGTLPPAPSPLGESALLLTFGEGIHEDLNRQVHRYATMAREARLPGILDLVPAYATLAVRFDPRAWSWEDLAAALEDRVHGQGEAMPPPVQREVVLPVCYGGDFGPDLATVASHTGLSALDVIARHTAAAYRVYFLGFSPGFPYLGGLDPALATPRRATPRPRVPRGSVGIAGLQTGIYPLASPGGWQLIGRTPLLLFDPEAQAPCPIQPGDRLRFEAIDEPAYLALSGGRP